MLREFLYTSNGRFSGGSLLVDPVGGVGTNLSRVGNGVRSPAARQTASDFRNHNHRVSCMPQQSDKTGESLQDTIGHAKYVSYLNHVLPKETKSRVL